MKCIIVDDEPLAIEGILMNIEELPTIELPTLEVVGTFNSAEEAKEFLNKYHVDLMFLDVSMPGMSGIEFLRSLSIKPLVIMTTAYREYALDGYDLGVVDYLMKPMRVERFIIAVNKAKELYGLRSLPCVEELGIIDFFYMRSEGKLVKLKYAEIICIEGMKDYVKVILKDKFYLTAMNVKTIYSKLPKDIFARVNQSYIINVKYISEITNDTIYFANKKTSLSKTYKKDFIKNYIETNLIGRK